MPLFNYRNSILWAVLGIIVIGLVVWTIVVGDAKRLPAPAAPGPETLNTNTTPTEDGQAPIDGTTEETPAPPPAETPEGEATPVNENTNTEPTEVTPSTEDINKG